MRGIRALVTVSMSFVVFSASVEADAMDGKTCYQKKMCAACHGAAGEGSKIAPPIKNLGKTKAELVAFFKTGGKKMKPVKGTDEELAACADCVLTLK